MILQHILYYSNAIVYMLVYTAQLCNLSRSVVLLLSYITYIDILQYAFKYNIYSSMYLTLTSPLIILTFFFSLTGGSLSSNSMEAFERMKTKVEALEAQAEVYYTLYMSHYAIHTTKHVILHVYTYIYQCTLMHLLYQTTYYVYSKIFILYIHSYTYTHNPMPYARCPFQVVGELAATSSGSSLNIEDRYTCV